MSHGDVDTHKRLHSCWDSRTSMTHRKRGALQSPLGRKHKSGNTMTSMVSHSPLLNGPQGSSKATGGILLYTPQRACRIVQACSMLHNLANQRGGLELHVDELDPGPAPYKEPNAASVQHHQDAIHRLWNNAVNTDKHSFLFFNKLL